VKEREKKGGSLPSFTEGVKERRGEREKRRKKGGDIHFYTGGKGSNIIGKKPKGNLRGRGKSRRKKGLLPKRGKRGGIPFTMRKMQFWGKK